MADGYARASGKPGVCMAQVIGALNLAAGLRDAYLAHSPVIAITGGRDPKTKFRKVYQEIDDVPAFEPVTKFNATVDDVARFPDMVRQAFRVATTGTPGPVHLQFRGNEGQVDPEEGRDGAAGRAAVRARAAVPAGARRAERARRRSALLQKAERPVIVAGGGVRASGAAAELVALAEALQIPVATSLNGKDSIPGTHPLSVGVVGSYSRESANRVVNRADLVCFIGSETGGMTTHFWAVPKIGTPAIQIDIEPEALGRNYPLQASVHGDAKVALAAMLAHRGSRQRRRKRNAVDRGDAGASARRVVREVQARCSSPTRCRSIRRASARELTQHVPDDAIVIVDTGHAGMWMGGMYDLRKPTRRATSAAPAISAGRSAPASAPRRRARSGRWSCSPATPDFWYHIGEIETAVRWNIPSVTLVNNNGGGNQSKRGFDRAYGGEQTEQVARTVDLQADELRQDRRGHRRARHPRREAVGDRPGAGQGAGVGAARRSSTSSPTSRRWRRQRSRERRWIEVAADRPRLFPV